MKFCITGLPRSRTAWFAAYFSAAGHPCAHEPFAKCKTAEDVERAHQKYEGISDSFMLFLPFDGKRVVIERDPEAVKKSLIGKFGFDLDKTNYLIEQAVECLPEVDGLRVKFEDINDRLQEIHEYCVDSPYDPELGEMFKNLNIQVERMEMTKEFISLVGGVLCQSG